MPMSDLSLLTLQAFHAVSLIIAWGPESGECSRKTWSCETLGGTAFTLFLVLFLPFSQEVIQVWHQGSSFHAPLGKWSFPLFSVFLCTSDLSSDQGSSWSFISVWSLEPFVRNFSQILLLWEVLIFSSCSFEVFSLTKKSHIHFSKVLMCY